MKTNEIDSIRYDVSGPRLAKTLNGLGYEAFYFSKIEDGVKKALELIPEGSTVSWGGSMTCVDSGLIEKVRAGKFNLIDRDKASSAEERAEMMRNALLSDVYLTSFNAVSEDGTVFNIDGNGNRVAAITFGPKSVIALVGMNKVCHTKEEALSRARQIAAVRNACRFGLKTTGCALTGHCQDCHAPDCICSVVQVLRFCKNKGRIKVILVGEEFGF